LKQQINDEAYIYNNDQIACILDILVKVTFFISRYQPSLGHVGVKLTLDVKKIQRGACTPNK